MKKTAAFLLILVHSPLALAESEAEREALKFFENEVRPVLANRCYECHGEKKKKGSLRLDHLSHMMKGGDSGPALEAGKPDASLIIKAIRYADPEFEMPPKEKLPAKEIAALEKWVKLGAPWPKDDAKQVAVDAFGFSAEQRKFWSFQPLGNPIPPEVQGDWARTPIDRFIAKKHTELGLTPAPEADRRELVRRVYFTLHGLPPTTAQSDAFVRSEDPQAYEKLVGELLASPRYGERWAQHWLDLTRYAESDGYNADAFRENAWPYRDYVIQSLNADKPYDQFVREQIAGDEMPAPSPAVLVATTYLRSPIYEWNQRDVRGQWDVILTDTTDNAGEVFLGLSYGCARCHDHKFDPILQKDYYRLRAFFAPLLWRDDLNLASADDERRFAAKQAEWEKATAKIREQMDAITGPLVAGNIKKAHDRFQEELQAAADKPRGQRLAQEAQHAYFVERQMEYERERFDALKSIKKAEDKKRYQELEQELKAFDSLKPAPLLKALVATDAGPSAPPNPLKTRVGETDIQPGFLTLLAPGEAPVRPLPTSTGRRTALADWITRADNPLSTRVITNRVWHYLFGRGLVATPNDFGKLGELPTHPELLDYLTQRFIAGGSTSRERERGRSASAWRLVRDRRDNATRDS